MADVKKVAPKATGGEVFVPDWGKKGHLSGGELKDQVIDLRPDIKALFMSGYTDDSITHSGILESDTAFIEKPFTPDGLARKAREVLEH